MTFLANTVLPAPINVIFSVNFVLLALISKNLLIFLLSWIIIQLYTTLTLENIIILPFLEVTYIIDLRVRKSIELLEEGISVTEAALSSGFFDLSYYTKIMNCTPREYVKNIR